MDIKKAVPAFLKKNRICPVCAVKRLSAASGVHVNGAERFDNGTALTPPMGWASWNLFRHNVNENIIEEMAKALRDTGLADLGYVYVNVDDCWMSSSRDENGRLFGDLATFPSGMKALVEKVNACGLKMGIYTSNGTHTCEDLPSSLGHERTDAETFAEWGVEYFKYDFCHNKAIPTSAPEIEKITLSRPGESEGKTYYAHEAELRGGAEVFEDKSLTDSGKYVGGLDSDGGAIVFYNIPAEESGEYTLTLGIRKAGKFRKFADITVNGKDTYPVEIPATNGGNHEGRHQLTVFLEKGMNHLMIRNPIASRADSAARQYRDMGKELKRASSGYAKKNGTEEKPICYSICEWGLNRPWKWGYTAGNLWRTTPDIRPTWNSIMSIYEVNVRLYAHAGPGNWNDPDMLEVGNGELTTAENRAHFTLWCMMASPLILGNDIRKFLNEDGTVKKDDPVFRIIADPEAIAIDRDRLGRQCRRIKTNVLTDVLVKPLENGEIAVCLLNKSGMNAEVGFSINDIVSLGFTDLVKADRYAVRDIWEKTDFIAADGIRQSVKPHSVVLYRIRGISK